MSSIHSISAVALASSITYDDHGNITALSTQSLSQTFSYDWANRLVSVSDDTGLVATYSYDALNRRVSKTVEDSNTTTTYIYQHKQVIQELEDTGAGPELARSFVYATYIDAAILIHDELHGRHYYIRDRRANVVALVDTSGEVQERYDYSAFGGFTVYNGGQAYTESQLGNPYTFTGRRWDAETQLFYYRNRMYAADLGRFLQRDPAGFIDGWNVYGYVSNSPLSLVDPYGLAGTSPRTNRVNPDPSEIAVVATENGQQYVQIPLQTRGWHPRMSKPTTPWRNSGEYMYLPTTPRQRQIRTAVKLNWRPWARFGRERYRWQEGGCGWEGRSTVIVIAFGLSPQDK